MVATSGKVKSISEDIDISEDKIATILYLYLSYCLEEMLIDGETKTIFGKLKLNENNRLFLETNKEGLISLLDKRDIKLLRKIAEEGPDTKIFGNL